MHGSTPISKLLLAVASGISSVSSSLVASIHPNISSKAYDCVACQKTPMHNGQHIGCCWSPDKCNPYTQTCENEQCGFDHPIQVDYTITDADKVQKRLDGKQMYVTLFESYECSQWRIVDQQPVKTSFTQGTTIKSSVSINHGCYGSAGGANVVLAACMTDIKLSKQNDSLTCLGKLDNLGTICFEGTAPTGICVTTKHAFIDPLPCCSQSSSGVGTWDNTFMPSVCNNPPVMGWVILGAILVLLGIGATCYYLRWRKNKIESQRLDASKLETLLPAPSAPVQNHVPVAASSAGGGAGDGPSTSGAGVNS